MKTYERIPEKVQAFQITQAMIDGTEALPEGVDLVRTPYRCRCKIRIAPEDALWFSVGAREWVVRTKTVMRFLSDAEFRARYREVAE